MNELDDLYQNVVEEQTTLLLKLDKSAIDAFPEYGDFSVFIQDKTVTGSWNRYQLSDNCYRIIFSLTRKMWLIGYRLYLSGIKIDSNGIASKLSDEEVADYD